MSFNSKFVYIYYFIEINSALDRLHFDSACKYQECSNNERSNFWGSESTGRKLEVKKVKIHPLYKSDRLIYDACLLRIEKFKPDGFYVNPILVGDPYDDIINKTCTSRSLISSFTSKLSLRSCWLG